MQLSSQSLWPREEIIQMNEFLSSLEVNIFDVIFVIIILVEFFIHYAKGFLYSVISLFKIIGSVLIAGYVSDRYASSIYDLYIEERLITKVAEKLADFKDGLISTFDEGILGEAISSYLSKHTFDDDINALSQTIVSENMENTILSGIQLILFLFVFILGIVILSSLQNLLLHTNEIPVLGFINRVLGGALGIIIGLLLIYLISMAISIILKYNNSVIPLDLLMESSLFSPLYKLNPFYV